MMRMPPRSFFILLAALFPAIGFCEEATAERSPGEPLPIAVDGAGFEENYVERQILRYEDRILDYQREIQSLLRRKVEEKRRLIEMKYKPSMDQESQKEKESRADAIVLFENFIKKYRGNAEYAPSAMYRLAELYYERSALEYEEEYKRYEEQIALYEKGQLAQEPVEPVVDLGPSIALYREIINSYPRFRYLGETYYMLGYYLDASKKSDEGISVWEELIRKDLFTKYNAEVHLRIGIYYFTLEGSDEKETKKNLYKALDHFKKSAEFKDYKARDKAIYNIAWTYYRLAVGPDAEKYFPLAIDTFASLVFYADEMKKRGVNEGQDMRKESVQYLAVSFSDEFWGSVEKAIDYFSKIDGRSFEVDVFDKMGKFYYENVDYEKAEQAYRHILKKYPYYADAPKIHKKLIDMYAMQERLTEYQDEIELFVKTYDADSEWTIKNRANATILRDAGNQAKEFLIASAGYHHKAAREAKKAENGELSRKEYLIAAQLYGKYLERFPYTSESYDVSYFLAESLYFSGQVEKAVLVYERVRDDKNQDSNRDDAGLMVYRCYSDIWEDSAERQKKGEEKRGTPLSKLEEKLVESGDIYLKISKSADDRSTVAFLLARIFFEHGNFEEAEKRYLSIINEFPDSELALAAARDIIRAYDEKKDWVNLAKWSKIFGERFSSSTKEKDRGKKEEEEFRTSRGFALFRYAEQLETEKKHREAAEEYLRIVEENPYYKDADAALFNAAQNFASAFMFDSALTIHERIYKEYPYSPFAPKSLYRVAINAERAYNFEKARDAYLLLYKKYPTDERKNDAIFNAAFLLEKLKRYQEAATYYALYAREEAAKPEGREAAFFVGFMYQKAEDWKRMVTEYNRFIDTYRSDPEVQNLVMRAYYQIAQTYEEKMNDWKSAKAVYAKMLEHYNAQKPEGAEANTYAAEAEFKLLEDEFAEYEKLKIGGKDEKKLAESLQAKMAASQTLSKKYDNVLRYRSEWSYAAFYRQGNILQTFAEALINSPPPPEIEKDPDLVDMYREGLQQKIDPLEQQAFDLYVRTLDLARQNQVSNKWITLIIERLARLRPQEYRAEKVPRYGMNTAKETGYPIALTLDRAERRAYKKAGMQDNKEDDPAKDSSQEKIAPPASDQPKEQKE